MTTNSPQAEQMAHESMVRNLAAQANAIWPQEAPLFARYALPARAKVLDVGCGTAEIITRLARVFRDASFVGVDVEDAHLARARQNCASLGTRVAFEHADALALPYAADTYDLTLSRHVLQAVPDPAKVVSELYRVTKPGGTLHLLAEDYGMLWCHPTPHDSDDFWQVLPQKFGAAIGCDNHIGRKMFDVLGRLGAKNIAVDYVVVDTIRVERETFAQIWEAWRDGYTDALSHHTGMPKTEMLTRWNEMISCVRSQSGYALWQVPVWSARK